MRRLAFLALALAACGGHDNHPMPDAAPPPCDFTEAADGTNNASAEDSALMIGDTTMNLCGQVNPGHFDAAQKTVDVDKLRVTLPGPADLLFRVFADTTALGDFSVMIFDTQPHPVLMNGVTYDASAGDHGVFAASLQPGTYDVWVVAKATADIGAPLDYKVRILPDHPEMRCPTVADPAAYTEAHDNADNLGNDVVSVDWTKAAQYALTASTSDAAEPSGVTLDSDAPKRISGSAANTTTNADAYLDRDTFQVMTGADTNELALRINWPAGGADLDAILFADGQMVPTGSTTRSGTGGDELTSFAVKPATSYWLWVGAAKGSTGLPAAYDVSLCGSKVVN